MEMPLVQAILDYVDEGTARFHVPGHKGMDLYSRLGFKLDWTYDLTEVRGTDNLQAPTGAIKRAQELAARAFGSDVCFFLVNGTTSGIHIMILYAARPGDKVLLARSCHKSVWDALVLSGAVPVYIEPEYDEDRGLYTQVSLDSVKRAVKNNPDIVAMVITSPNYYGMVGQLEEICSYLRDRGILSLVDEAHGGHFIFNRKLPPSAADAGADIWVQSAHKTLPSLTQASYLHARSDRVDTNVLASLHSMMMTTSPSYLLMASLDLARAYMEDRGQAELDRLIELVAASRQRLNRLGIDTMTSYARPELVAMDPTRLVLDLSSLSISGFEAEGLLRDRGIQVEMSDLTRLVCVSSLADKIEDFDRLVAACDSLLRQGSNKDRPIFGQNPRLGSRLKKGARLDSGALIGPAAGIPDQVLSPRQAFFGKKEYVPLARAQGRVCAGLVGSYPPGIPSFCPGDLIDKAGLEYLSLVKDRGGQLFGLRDEDLVAVVKD